MIKITTSLPDGQYLSEIYQSMQVRQALLHKISDTEYERITPFILCRDFLTDVYTFSQAKQDFSIYGMSFKGSTQSPDWDKVYILLRFPDKKARENLYQHSIILFSLEHNNKIYPHTEIYDISELESLVVGPREWLKSCLTFSLYTFLLRAFCNEFIASSTNWWIAFKEKLGIDAGYTNSINPETWETILNNLSILYTDEFCGFPVSTEHNNLHRIHNNSGFISIFGRHTEINPLHVRDNKHWQIMQQKGIKTAIV